jgi:hypothetical protein
VDGLDKFKKSEKKCLTKRGVSGRIIKCSREGHERKERKKLKKLKKLSKRY